MEREKERQTHTHREREMDIDIDIKKFKCRRVYTTKYTLLYYNIVRVLCMQPYRYTTCV